MYGHQNVNQHPTTIKTLPDQLTYKFTASILPSHAGIICDGSLGRWEAGHPMTDMDFLPYDPLFAYQTVSTLGGLGIGHTVAVQTGNTIRVFGSFNESPKGAAVWCPGFAKDGWHQQSEGQDKAIAVIYRGDITITWLGVKQPIDHEQFCVLPPIEETKRLFRPQKKNTLKIYPRMCMLRDIIMVTKSSHYVKHLVEQIHTHSDNLINRIASAPRGNRPITDIEDEILSNIVRGKTDIVDQLNGMTDVSHVVYTSSGHVASHDNQRRQLLTPELDEILNNFGRLQPHDINTFQSAIHGAFYDILLRFINKHKPENRNFDVDIALQCVHVLATYLQHKISMNRALFAIGISKVELDSLINDEMMTTTILIKERFAEYIRNFITGVVKGPLKAGNIVQVYVDCLKKIG